MHLQVMQRVLHEAQDTSLPHARADGDSLWLDRDELARATGWHWKPEGLCRDEVCMPIPRQVDGERLDVAGLWRYAGWPIAHAGGLWVLGEGAARRAGALTSLTAPDFELPALDGRIHRLSDYRGRRVFMVTWASWCGCRGDLPVWQSLYEATKAHGFTVLTVALDQPEAARPFVEAARPDHPSLIDRDHRVAELYNLVNVPQAVWIDETGRIVRPPEVAGMGDSFRAMDRRSWSLPEGARAERDRLKKQYLDAVRDWAERGAASPYVLDEETVLARLALPDAKVAQAHAHFRLGQALLRDGRVEEAKAQLAEATRLHPGSWAMWRQNAEKNATGLAVGEAFWRRVDALGARPYYVPSDL
jgi:peroxiredoxin